MVLLIVPISLIVLVILLIISIANMDKTKNTPKDVFLLIFNILAFYISAVAFIVLYVQYINALFPDALSFYYTGIIESVRWASSVLIIAVPAFLITSWLLAKDYIKNPEKRETKLRKWVIYFTLFVSAITIVVDLITFVYNFLGGELSTRFFLKILTVLIVAAAVFGYYMWELKREDVKSKVSKTLALIVSVVVLGSIIAGFFIVGTPADQRNRTMDERRISDLQTIQNEVVNYWIQKEALPSNLSELQNSISGFVPPKDPETKQPYEYNIKDSLAFELCAIFETSSDDFRGGYSVAPKIYYPGDFYSQNWEHEKGEACFERRIDPELYKKVGEPGLMRI